MKLTIASVAAILTLAGAASAMTESASLFDDPRAASLGANGQTVSGKIAEVDIEDAFEARARALNASETVEITVFATDAPDEVQVNADY
jgi:O-methyltransferase involved in polyketide biosynthesis